MVVGFVLGFRHDKPFWNCEIVDAKLSLRVVVVSGRVHSRLISTGWHESSGGMSQTNISPGPVVSALGGAVAGAGDLSAVRMKGHGLHGVAVAVEVDQLAVGGDVPHSHDLDFVDGCRACKKVCVRVALPGCFLTYLT